MPDKTIILYPSIVMALLTLAMILSMGLRRFLAVQTRRVGIKYYRTYDDGPGEPERMRQHSRHVQNHFELPTLFHLAVWATFLLGTVNALTLAVAWLFVGSRCLHSFIHLGYNDVTHRFLAYGLGLFAVLFLWARLLATLL
jgi:hypothetical protein